MKLTVNSKLFPLLIEPYEDQAGLRILDLSTALPETVNFFSQYKCRLQFVDIFDEYALSREREARSGDGECNVLDLDQRLLFLFQELLDFPAGTHFDICLLWDFLNYLDLPALRAFSSALAPYLHSGTKGHGFCLLNSRNSLPNQNYGVVEKNVLVCSERSEKQARVYSHGQGVLEQNNFCLRVSKSLLLADGRIEMLLSNDSSKGALSGSNSRTNNNSNTNDKQEKHV